MNLSRLVLAERWGRSPYSKVPSSTAVPATHFGSTPYREPICILVVNDIEIIRRAYVESIEEFFKDIGLPCKVIQAHSVKDALEKTKHHKPTFAFIDYNLDHAGYDSFANVSYRSRQVDEALEDSNDQTGLDLAETLEDLDGVSAANIAILSGASKYIRGHYPILQAVMSRRSSQKAIFEDFFQSNQCFKELLKGLP